MTQENKDLLLKDLCARLPYGVKFRYKYVDCFFHETYGVSTLEGVIPPYHIIHSTLVGEEYLQIEKDEIKPYLFPLSSMTEEQKEEYCSLQQKVIYNSKGLINSDVMEYVNYCYKNHIDINNLIPKGSAIDATGLNIY